MRTLAFLIFAASSLCWAQFPTDGRGIIITSLPAAQDNLLGPLIPSGNSPWIFGDLAETGVALNMAPLAIAQTPVLGTALAGTWSWVQGTQTFTTSANQTAALSGAGAFVVTWPTVDGAGTGRFLCASIGTVTATTVGCDDGDFNEPTTSGATAYLLPPPISLGGNLVDFSYWTSECPSTVWNYYDNAIALYRLYYRTGNTTYQTQARAYADITWQWTIDHGYHSVCPRSATMLSQFFRALDGHPERFPGLYNWISIKRANWADVTSAATGNWDARESGYWLWAAALGAKTDTDPTRHVQYCTWVATYTAQWNSVQGADGSFGEKLYGALGGGLGYVSAPKSFTPPFIWPGSPWRIFAGVKALEGAYESLSDTSSQGCNNSGANTALAATTLTTITNVVTWQNNYGRNSVGRGFAYEVNSQSDDQNTVYHPGGTVSINLSSTTLTGVGTNWQTAGYCDGTHFIGLEATFTVYKIASCVSNTSATLSNAFGLYGSAYTETSNLSGSQYSIAPAAGTSCNSSATYCGSDPNDRNLTRPICGDIGWLYAKTLNPTYLGWTSECLSATLGGPTSGLTASADLAIGNFTLPCSGPACDGYIGDLVASAATCGSTPCIFGSYPYSNLGKNFGEAFGAPGIDNALADLLMGNLAGGSELSGQHALSGTIIHH